jgi:hypothetical protein
MSDNKAWIVAVDMGYGHQRPAHALRHLAYRDKIITANNYDGIVESDRKFWKKSNSFYNFISKFKKVPIIGPILFNAFDKFQEIERFYPKRDLSEPSFILHQIYRLIRRGWGKHLIEKLSKDPKPLICTFFTPAFMAEEYNYPGEIYLVVTDSDISRTWAPMKSKTTRIKYLAPTVRAVERLKQYGIPEKQIIFTGFPLPLENTGTEKLEHVKERILYRLKNLDPKLTYFKRYAQNISRFLNHNGDKKYPEKADHPLTLAFAIGGAGAQKELGTDIIKSLCKNVCDAVEQMCKNVLNENIYIIFIAGTHLKAKEYFEKTLKELGLEKSLGTNIEILYEKDFESYYKTFNKTLDRIDILWTKPSELSFYTALGIPLVMAPPIGSQEKMNMHWVQQMGAGMPQEDVRYTTEWITDWLDDGILAEAAIEGFVEAPIHGTFNIEKAVFGKSNDN